MTTEYPLFAAVVLNVATHERCGRIVSTTDTLSPQLAAMTLRGVIKAHGFATENDFGIRIEQRGEHAHVRVTKNFQRRITPSIPHREEIIPLEVLMDLIQSTLENRIIVPRYVMKDWLSFFRELNKPRVTVEPKQVRTRNALRPGPAHWATAGGK